jgi:hypothetical protein
VIFVFLVITLLSSLSAVAFVIDNSVFATSKKDDSSSGDGGGSRGDKGSGSSDNGGGSDNSNGAGSSTDNTSTPPAPEENTAPPSQNQQTCPDGSTPDASGACTTIQSAPPTNTLNAQQPTGVPPECQGIVAGSSDKCSLGTTGSPTSPINGPPLTPQQQYEQCLKGIGGGIPGNCKPPAATPPSSTDTASNGPAPTPQQQYEDCLRGIGGGIPGNCKPPPATLTGQNVAPLQTLTPQQTCKDGSAPDASGMCQDGSTPQQVCSGGEVLDAKGDCVSPGESQAIKNGTIIPMGDGRFKLATAPPVPNTNTIAPICPVGFHLELNKCISNGASCPSGTDQDGDICRPQPNPGPCGRPDYAKFHGICYQGKETVPNPDGSCPPTTPISFEGRCFDKLPVLPGSKTGSGGGFIQMFPVNPPPATPPTDTPPVQPPTTTPPATPPTDTPPVQPQPPQQVAPSQPECVPGFHWDNTQQKCMSG